MEITVSELRFAWLVLGCALLVTPPPGSAGAWVGALALLVPGGWLLARPTQASRIAQALTEALSARAVRVAAILVAGVFVVSAWILSVSAALVLLLLLGSALMARALHRGAPGVQGMLAGSLLLGISVLAAGLLLEGLLGGVLAERIGAPSVREAWHRRYAAIARRNMFGFRSAYETVVAPPGTTRILALGDSYTWGDGILRTEETWPAQLEQLLRNGGYAPVQVINTGHSGWTTANEAELLRRFGWQWMPDLVVLQFTLNDVTESGPGFHSRPDPRLRVLPHRFRTGAISRSTVLFLLETRLSRIRNPYWGSTNPARFHPDSLAWRQTVAALREIADSARARRVPVVLLIYPLLEPGAWSQDTHPFKKLTDQVVQAGREAGMDVLNLVEVYGAQGRDWKRWWVSPYDPHPNPAANAVAVRALCDRIRERGYLVPRRAAAAVEPLIERQTPLTP